MVTRADSQTPADPQGLHAIVLAAGAGTRMGGEKLRRPWRRRPLLEWSLATALAAPAERVWAVAGADAELEALAPADARLSWVTAEGWASGLSASLKAGVAALPDSAKAAIVFLGDMPRVPAEIAAALIAAWRAGGAAAVAPAFQGRRGHPVLLDRSLFPAIAALEGGRGAGALLADLGDRLVLVPASDDGVLFDVDTPDLLDA